MLEDSKKYKALCLFKENFPSTKSTHSIRTCDISSVMVLSAQSQYVTTEIRQDGVAIISYNRPEVANAINVNVMKVMH